MKLSNRLLHMLVVSIACVSCVPFPMRHYYPKAQGGKVIYNQCPINGHLPYELLLTKNGIRTYARLGKDKEKHYLEIRFEIPETGKTVKLVEARARLLSNQTDVTTDIEFHEIYLSPFVSVINSPDPTQVRLLDVHEPMMADTKDLGGLYRPAEYWLASYLELPDSNKLQIVLPQFTVNEELIILPAIEFERKWIVGFAVINC